MLGEVVKFFQQYLGDLGFGTRRAWLMPETFESEIGGFFRRNETKIERCLMAVFYCHGIQRGICKMNAEDVILCRQT